jgi:ABC-type multidrug transport system fused ATPase/permease subunit
VSIDDLDSDKIRSQVAFLSKKAVTYAGTIRQNIDPTGSFSDEAIIRVLKYLKANEILDNEKGGMKVKKSSSGANSKANNSFNLGRNDSRRVRNSRLNKN